MTSLPTCLPATTRVSQMWRDPYGYRPLTERLAAGLTAVLVVALTVSVLAELLRPAIPWLVTGSLLAIGVAAARRPRL